MKLFVVVMRRIVIIFGLAMLAIGGVLAWSPMGAAVGIHTLFSGKLKSQFQKHDEEFHPAQKIIVSSPKIEDVVVTESFVCQIRSQRHIEVRALEGGYLDKILVNEGQAVKEGDVMFQILPTLYKAKLDAENAKAKLAQLKYKYTQQLVAKNVVSENEAALLQAELAQAQANANLAGAEFNFTDVRARFDGIVDRLLQREGSLIKEGDILTTLADNSVMWVYFNVPEKYYLNYMATRNERTRAGGRQDIPAARQN
jgi:membrane fusion protein (multidrug efflux system)